jgi:hypothetical protein
MAYDRYDRDERRRDRRPGDFEDRERRGRFGERDFGRERDERGFFERAGDEISSWFGDEEAERRRQRDMRMGGGGRYERDYSERSRRARSERDEDLSYRPMGWTASDRDYQSGYDRSIEPHDYRPVTGDYGRSGNFDEDRPGFARRGRREELREEPWDRDEYRRTSFAGSSARSQWDDPHYEEWKRREMDALDRDYDEFRSEHQSRFDEDFAGWREKKQSKRQLLGRIREHMDVVGRDGKHVGTVDRVAGDRVILTRSDPDSGGVHHSISCTMIGDVDENRVTLDMDADKARERWRDDSRERALFEREDQGRAGPGILNRSFSGTYR